MRKRMIIISAVSVFLLAGCGHIQPQPTNPEPPATSPQDQLQSNSGTDPAPTNGTAGQEESFTGTIKDLIAKGTSMECTWSTKDQNAAMKGTMKVMGKQFRSDVTVASDDPKQPLMDVHSISDGEWLYMWNALQPTMGSKMKLSDMEEAGKELANNVPQQQKNEAIDFQKKMNYTCKPWSVNNEDFTLPDGVNFQDMTQIMKQMQQGMQGAGTTAPAGENSACSMCQKLPDPTSRTNCLKSAGCQ